MLEFHFELEFDLHFEFTLDLSDIDLWNIDLLDTQLVLLDTEIPDKHFVCLQDVLKTSSRHFFKTSSRHVFKTSSRHVFKTSSRHVFKTFSRHVLKTSSRPVFKSPWRRLQRNNFSSSRRLQDVLENKKWLRWRRIEDVFKTCLEDVLNINKYLLGSSTLVPYSSLR